jgi:uncharacterized protein YbjT (DUF2867 family)
MTQKRIAVAGGTGCIGRMVVAAARDAGHETVVLARSAGVDLVSGRGVAEALRGVDVVVDVTNINSTRRAKATAFFEAETRTLIDARVPHLVALSIVGIDRVGIGYYQAKLRQEELLRESGVPSTVLRASQFFEFASQMTGLFAGPFVPAPRMLCQPVAAREVAAELVRIAGGPPQGRATDIAGPEQLWMNDMIRQLLKAQHRRQLAVPIRLPGRAGRAQANGGLLPRGEVTVGRIRYAEWLSSPDGHATVAPAGEQ